MTKKDETPKDETPAVARPNRDEMVLLGDWDTKIVAANTRCKHGWGSCEKCGTRERSDVIHTSRTPNKRDARRLRKKIKK
jgi:hypothetical protein